MNEDLPSPLICDGDDTTPNNGDECMNNNSTSRAINATDTAAYRSNVGRHITNETSDDDSRFSQTSKMSSVPTRASTTASTANDDEGRSVPGAGHENNTVTNDAMEFNDTREVNDENSGGTDPALTTEVDALASGAPNKDDELYDADDGDDNGTDSDNEFGTNQDSDAEQSHDETDRSGTDEGGLFGWLDEHEANENVNFFFRIRTSNGRFTSVTKKRTLENRLESK